MLEYSSSVRNDDVKNFAEMHASSAGIQWECTHAPRWNTVEMYAQIKREKSKMHAFSAGIQFVVEKMLLAKMLEFSKEKCWNTVKKVLKIAGSVENSTKQVIKRPRVLTPKCWKPCVLRGSFSEKFDTTSQNH